MRLIKDEIIKDKIIKLQEECIDILKNEKKELKEKIEIAIRTIERNQRLLKNEKNIDKKTISGYSARDVLIIDCANTLKEIK